MSTSTHRIRRQRWAIKAPSEASALSIRRQMREMWEIGAQPAFEAAFDAVAPGPESVRLPRLEVSVKVQDVHELLGVLQERVREELRRLVEAARATAAQAVSADKPAPAAHDHPDGALAHYVRFGNVPWHAIARDPAPAIQALERAAGDSLEATLAALSGLSDDEATLAAGLFRLLQLLPEQRWPSAASRFLGPAMRPPVALTELLDEIAGPTGNPIPRHGRIRLVADLIAALATTAPRGRAGDELAASQVLREVVASWMREAAFRTPVNVLALMERFLVDPECRGAPATGLHRQGRPPEAMSATSTNDQRTATSRPASGSLTASSRETLRDRFHLAVASAGLVLLHPYLSQLFKAVRLVVSDGMRPESPPVARAAALLHLLATGREEPYELELGFIKVLLGFTPEAALPVARGLLTDADQEEAHALLQAVVTHWTALKHTSVGALRASFLQRTGLLGEDENGWRLRVEPGPFDALLDRLPWGIGTVKLPWMKRPIHCEWPTA